MENFKQKICNRKTLFNYKENLVHQLTVKLKENKLVEQTPKTVRVDEYHWKTVHYRPHKSDGFNYLLQSS